jgi:iron complex outermembrane receptor protein
MAATARRFPQARPRRASKNVGAYIIANFRYGFRTENGREVFGWVRNAFGAGYFDFRAAAPAGTGLVVGQLGDPRTHGLTVTARF